MPPDSTPQVAPDGRSVAELATAIADDGYVIVPGVWTDTQVAQGRRELETAHQRLGTAPGGNDFEGFHTRRVYNLLVHGGETLRSIPEHPLVLAVVRSVLGRDCLLSSLSSIAIGPGETEQPLHADDILIPLPRPHLPVICNSMWALTDFTAANGATRLAPGSHLSGDGEHSYGDESPTVAAEMGAGGVLIWTGSLWHKGGANATGGTRVGIAANYCSGWVRQQENQQLGVPRELVAGFSPTLRRLVGYGVASGLIGHIERRSPDELLLGGAPSGVVWDSA